ncbi:MlaD family protein [Nocardia arthritidis]|uniref:MCE family protein n=1 Tax=Nocardia arthritidis TaxID=228602 RepID=A0A6G9YIK9_9NOCA|nr:MlaD family protein [Nocardia arthritidis]QIS13042.1 MCE family protein [Nocardia arthritidis]
MKRVLASPGFVTVVGAVLSAVVAVAGYLVVYDPVKPKLAYCALMPDAVGLYPGNHVTMLGVTVGSVTAIRAEGRSVRVDFTVDAAHPLRGDPSATTVSDTLVADRNLAVLGESGGAPWVASRCLTKTFTPKSISETLQGFSDLAAQLGGGDNPAEQTRIRDSVAALQSATAGTGPKFNALVRDLANALRKPDAAIDNIGALIDSVSAIGNSMAVNWESIKTVVTLLNTALGFINELWDTTVKWIDSLLVIMPWLNRLAREYGRPLLGALDGAVPGLRLLAAHVGTLQDLVNMLPPLVDSFQSVIDPVTGWPRITYAAPKVAVPRDQADQVCAAIDAVAPGRCAGADAMSPAGLIPMVLGMVGAR